MRRYITTGSAAQGYLARPVVRFGEGSGGQLFGMVDVV